MSTPVRLNLDGSYVNGAIPLVAVNVAGGVPAWFVAVDEAQMVSINGDLGSSHAPTVSITVGGAGFVFAGSTLLTAGGFRTTFGSGVRLTHDDNDYIEFGVAATANVTTSMLQAFDASKAPSRIAYSSANDAMTTVQALGGGRMIVPIDVYNGATIISVTFYFTVSSGHIAVPTSLPSFRVFKVDVLGNVTPLLNSVSAAGWVGNGFVQFNPPPASGAAWIADTTFVYVCDAGVVVDTTQYAYFAELIDESGSNAVLGNEYHSVVANMQNIQDFRPV